MEDFVVNFGNSEKKAAFIEYLKTLKTPRVIFMELPQMVRNDNVNSFYRVILTYISKDSGHSVEELHDIFVAEYLPDVLFSSYSNLSTANISQQQMIDYVKKVKHFYQRFSGKYIPDSTEFIRPKTPVFTAEEYAEKFDLK